MKLGGQSCKSNWDREGAPPSLGPLLGAAACEPAGAPDSAVGEAGTHRGQRTEAAPQSGHQSPTSDPGRCRCGERDLSPSRPGGGRCCV